jgi:hypothetical protein
VNIVVNVPFSLESLLKEIDPSTIQNSLAPRSLCPFNRSQHYQDMKDENFCSPAGNRKHHSHAPPPPARFSYETAGP